MNYDYIKDISKDDLDKITNEIRNNPNKIAVFVDYVKKLKEELRKINETKLEDIIWIENGKELFIPKEKIDEFNLYGLSNVDFIMGKYYE